MEQLSSEVGSQHRNDDDVYRKEDGGDVIPQLLKLAAETNSILHCPIEEMSSAEISRDETKRIVANMIYSIRPEQLKAANAPFNKAAGMAANQWNIKKRIFLFCPAGSDKEVRVIFNPTYKPVTPTATSSDDDDSKSTNYGREGCFSVPHAYGIVERHTHIEISYVDEKGIEHRNERLSGWEARVWQHETDHLDGMLYANRRSGINNGPNCTELHRFKTKEEFEAHSATEKKND